MGEWIVSLAGTEAGARLALMLALFSALAHAVFGAINKGGSDVFLTRGAINISYALMMAPFALLVMPLPDTTLWFWLGISYVVHIIYEYLQASAFERGAFTLVYPISRGTGPLVALVLAAIIFGEHFTAWQWAGGVMLSLAIMGLAVVNIRKSKAAHGPALGGAIRMALATGIMLAVYTAVDAYGIRQADNPFTFLVWFFVLGGFGFPFIAYARWRSLAVKPALRPFAIRGVIGASVALFSFSAVMLATRIDSVGQTAALRETSIIFATAIGVLIFREKIDASRLLLIGIIAAGAVLVEVG